MTDVSRCLGLLKISSRSESSNFKLGRLDPRPIRFIGSHGRVPQIPINEPYLTPYSYTQLVSLYN